MQFQKVQKTTILDYPKHLVIYAKPKIGKTDLVSRLPDCGIIDIEGGSDYIKGYIHVVKDEKNDPIQTLKNLDECLNWLIAEKPYKYVAFDTMTAFEEAAEIECTYDYMNSSIGKNFNVVDDDLIKLHPHLAPAKGVKITHDSPYFQLVTNVLPNGAGYKWLRETYKKYFNKMKMAGERVIFICHIKDKFIDTKAGAEVTGRELDLTGKLKSITTSFVDTIGYLNRGKDGNTYLSFQAGESVAEGSRRGNLSGRNILIGEWDKEKKDYKIVHWNEIYPDVEIK